MRHRGTQACRQTLMLFLACGMRRVRTTNGKSVVQITYKGTGGLLMSCNVGAGFGCWVRFVSVLGRWCGCSVKELNLRFRAGGGTRK